MLNSLFDKNTMKHFDSLARKQAKLDERKKSLVQHFMENLDSDTINDIFQIVKKYGHPNEKKLSEEIEKKYFLGEDLEFDDLMNLESLYKSNYKNFSQKG